MKLPWVYIPLDVEPSHLSSVIETLRSENVRGANVTVPLKTLILRHVDRVDPSAQGLNSVNTIYKKQGLLHGASTDGEGFLLSLGSWCKSLKGSKGMIVGAGGAARAVGNALACSGVKTLMIANWIAKEAESLRVALHQGFPRLQMVILGLKEGEKALSDCDWIVQATSLGLKEGDPSPLSLKKARSATWVIDLIYHRETEFLKEAGIRKLPFKNGLGMLLHQGALSFKLWTGQSAPLSDMKRALLRSLGRRNQALGSHR
jgi:shikimate dehydrogenase